MVSHDYLSVPLKKHAFHETIWYPDYMIPGTNDFKSTKNYYL